MKNMQESIFNSLCFHRNGSAFLIILLFLLLVPVSGHGKTVELELNTAVERRVLFYTTNGMIIVPPGSIQYAYSEGRFIGQVRVDGIFPTYLSGDVVSGKFIPYEGKLFYFGPETNEPPAGEIVQPVAPVREEKLYVSQPSLLTIQEPVPEKKEKPKPEKKTVVKEKKSEPKREVIKVPEPVIPKPEPIPTGNKRSGHPAVNSLSMRYESHSGDTQPDYTFTSVLSASKWAGKSIRTVYAIYEYKSPEETTTNTTVLGGNFIHFVTNSFYTAAGLSYTLKETKKDNYSSMAFSLNKLVGYKKDKNTYLRLSGSYSSLTDLDERGSVSAGANYYILPDKTNKLDFGYKYLYNVELKEHIQNRYSIDYTFPLSSSTKLSLGWRLVENVLTGALNDDYDSFRLTLSFTD